MTSEPSAPKPSPPAFEDEPRPPASLAEAQRLLVGVIQHPRALAAMSELHDAVKSVAAGSARLSALEQADVYREQFWLRHVASLLEDFPTLRALLGEEGFRALAEKYLAAHPPREFMVRDLSRAMPGFLATCVDYKDDALLADCAAIEWAFIDAFDAPNPKPFDAASLAGASEDALMTARLVLQAPLRLVAMGHPAHEYREAVRNGQTPPRPAPRSVRLAVFREADELKWFELEPAAFDVVSALVEGAPLEDACDRAIARGADEDDVASKLGQWFEWWTRWGWLERVVLP